MPSTSTYSHALYISLASLLTFSGMHAACSTSVTPWAPAQRRCWAQCFASLADAPVGLVYALKPLACHRPGHDIAYVRQAGAWVRADDAHMAAVGDDLHSVVADVKERGWLPRVLFYVARAGGA